MPKLVEWMVTFRDVTGAKRVVPVWTANQVAARESIMCEFKIGREAILAVVKMSTGVRL